jgi:hypothetical protein
MRTRSRDHRGSVRRANSTPNLLTTTSQRPTAKSRLKPGPKSPPLHSFEASNWATSPERANTKAGSKPARTQRRHRSTGRPPFAIATAGISDLQANHLSGGVVAAALNARVPHIKNPEAKAPPRRLGGAPAAGLRQAGWSLGRTRRINVGRRDAFLRRVRTGHRAHVTQAG